MRNSKISKEGTNLFPEEFERKEKDTTSQGSFKFLNEKEVENFEHIEKQAEVIEFPQYVETGNGFETVIRITGFEKATEKFWLVELTKTNGVNVVITVKAEDPYEVKKGFNENIKKQTNKYAKTKEAYDQYIAQKEIIDTQEFLDEIVGGGNDVLRLTIHLNLFAVSKLALLELNTHVQKLIDQHSLETIIPKNEMCKSLNVFSYTIKNPINASTAAFSNTFNFFGQDLEDPEGFFLGETTSGGNIMLDMFRNDKLKNRISYDGLVIGKKGVGKSVLLQNISLQHFLKGVEINIIDQEGEYINLSKKLGGEIVDVQGTNANIMNPLEYRFDMVEVVEETGNGEYITRLEKSLTLADHVTNFSIFMRFFNSEMTAKTISLLKSLTLELYKNNHITEDMDVEEIPPSHYFPVLADLKSLIGEEAKKIRNILDLQRNGEEIEITKEEYGMFIYEQKDFDLNNISDELHILFLTVKDIIESFGQYFNHTSNNNIKKNQLICFNLKPIVDNNDPRLQKAMIFNILNIHATKRMNYNKKYNDSRASGTSRRYYQMFLDEAHLLFNNENIEGVKWLTKAVKLFRKYSSSLLVASQSLRDYLIEDKSSELGKELKKIFEEASFKFIMKQDPSSMEDYRAKLGDALTEEDLEQIRNFGVGEFKLLLPDGEKIHGQHIVNENILEWFKSENISTEEDNE